MSVRTCSNSFLERPGGYGKSPCFLWSSVSRSVDVDWSGVVSVWFIIAFGRM